MSRRSGWRRSVFSQGRFWSWLLLVMLVLMIIYSEGGLR